MDYSEYFKNKDFDFTKEMENFYEKRTKKHISLVQKYCKKIYEYDKERFKEILKRAKVHDKSKYESPERIPYIFITWQYKCKDEGKEFKIPKEIQEAMNKATEHHVTENRHHPEFHDEKMKFDNFWKGTSPINRNDRDAIPEKKINATKMNDIDIAEMVADWCGMSEEKGTKPKAWADKNVNIRWKFTEKQTDLIYELIEAVWKN